MKKKTFEIKTDSLNLDDSLKMNSEVIMLPALGVILYCISRFHCIPISHPLIATTSWQEAVFSSLIQQQNF